MTNRVPLLLFLVFFDKCLLGVCAGCINSICTSRNVDIHCRRCFSWTGADRASWIHSAIQDLALLKLIDCQIVSRAWSFLEFREVLSYGSPDPALDALLHSLCIVEASLHLICVRRGLVLILVASEILERLCSHANAELWFRLLCLQLLGVVVLWPR